MYENTSFCGFSHMIVLGTYTNVYVIVHWRNEYIILNYITKLQATK